MRKKSSDAELPELPYKALPQTPEFTAAAEASPPTIVNGPFSGLVGRLRDTKASPGSEEQAGTELWLTEGNGALPELAPDLIEVNPDDSAELIHDEVGMFIPESMSLMIRCSNPISSIHWQLWRVAPPRPMPGEIGCLGRCLRGHCKGYVWLLERLAGTWLSTRLYRCFSQDPTHIDKGA